MGVDKILHFGVCFVFSIVSPAFALGLAIGKEYGMIINRRRVMGGSGGSLHYNAEIQSELQATDYLALKAFEGEDMSEHEGWKERRKALREEYRRLEGKL